MSKRYRFTTTAILFGALAFGATLMFFLGRGSARPPASEAKAAEDKPAPKARFYLREAAVGRNFANHCPPRFGPDVQAYREISPSAQPRYFVKIRVDREEWTLTPEDLSTLIKLDKQLKGQKRTEADGLASSDVIWLFHDAVTGKEESFSYTVGGGWTFFGESFIPTLEGALTDIETLKKIKPSVSW